MPTRAELVALAITTLLAVPIIVAYLIDTAGFGLAPMTAVGVTAAAVTGVVAMTKTAVRDHTATAVFALTLTASAAYLVWLAWPSLLPQGSGPDLTHHLLLVDYLQQHGTLVHDPQAWRELGEMADYTPGLHLLAVMFGDVVGVDGFFTVYPIVALSVALKFAWFSLIAWRFTRSLPGAFPISVAGLGLLLHLSPLTVHSFTHDSFLAQVVAELFALVMLWALVVWTESSATSLMIVAGIGGAAVFLTWPLWIGPLLIALVLTVATAVTLAPSMRVRHVVIALAPIGVIAALHTAGRWGAMSIVGTSGAVAPPPLTMAMIWFPLLALAGMTLAARFPGTRTLVWLTFGLCAQAVVLWGFARSREAATPYMAIKMTYLLVYPAAAAALLAIAAVARTTSQTWVAALLIVMSSFQSVRETGTAPIVDPELFAVGSWARAHLPRECVDYLVRNEYTAYWLHLAVMRNARMTERSANNDLYLTEPAFARWIEDRADVPYAIARWSVLPADIRERVTVLHRVGDATIITRSRSTPLRAAGACAASPRPTGS